MPARKNAPVLALVALLVVIAALVGWLLVGTNRRAATSPDPNAVPQAVAPGSEGDARKDASSTVLAEVPRDATSAAPRVEAPLDRARLAAELPAAGDLADAFWVEGRVKFPTGTPLDERVVVVAQGREFAGKKLHKCPVAGDGSFRVAFSKETRKAWLRLESRYVYLEETKPVDAQAQPRDVELAPQLGGGIRGRLVPSAAAAAFSKDLVGATVTMQGWKEGTNGPPRLLSAKADERLEFELGGLDPAAHWSISVAPSSFAPTSRETVQIQSAKLLPLDIDVQRGVRVTGVVRDEAGAPVDGVRIRIDGVWDNFGSNPALSKIVTDKEGRYAADAVPIETKRIGAVKSGYVSRIADELAFADGSVRDGLDFVLERGPTIQGVVRWGDGKPASGVRVSAEVMGKTVGDLWWLREEDLATKTAADGTFTLSGVRDGEYRVSAQSSPKEVATAEASSGKSAPRVRHQAELEGVKPPARELVLVLGSGSAVRGRVVDDVGAPVTAFSVEALPVRENDPWMRTTKNVSRSFHPDDGKFELLGLADGSWDVSVTTKLGQTSPNVRVVLPGAAQPLEIVLDRLATFRGTVLDPAGVPIANATIDYDRDDDQQSWRWNRNAEKGRKSDEKGNFTFQAMPGTGKISAKAAAWAPSADVEFTVAPAGEAGPFSLQLRRGGTIAGLVLDKTGKPASGRTVNTWGSGDSVSATSDAEGRFRLEHLTPGQVHVSMQPSSAEMTAARGPDGDVDWETVQPYRGQKTVEVAEGQVVEVVLGGALTGGIRVFGSVTGEGPVAKARVFASRMLKEGETSTGDNEYHSARTKEDGSYELTVSGPGRYHFQVNTPQGGIARLEREIPAGASCQVDFQLPTGRIAGRVLSPDGKPLKDVSVGTHLQDERPFSESVENAVVVDYGSASTDADGAFLITNLPPGKYTISARIGDRYGRSPRTKATASYAPAKRDDVIVTTGTTTDGVVLRMTEGGTVRGVVLGTDGKPRGGAEVTLESTPAHDDEEQNGETDASGRFEFTGVPPGAYSVLAVLDEEVSRPARGIDVRGGAATEVSLQLERGGTVRVFVENADGRLSPTYMNVVDEKGSDWSSKVMWPNGEGEPAVIGPLPAGTYRVSLPILNAGPGESVSVSAGASVDVRLRKPAPQPAETHANPPK